MYVSFSWLVSNNSPDIVFEWMMRGCLCRVLRTYIWFMVPFPWIVLDCEMVFHGFLFKIENVWIANINQLLPKTPNKGWWSVETIRILYPNVNMLECSRLQETAKTSLLVGEYLDSVPWVKRDLAYINFQSSLQQTGALSQVQLQCCCCKI